MGHVFPGLLCGTSCCLLPIFRSWGRKHPVLQVPPWWQNTPQMFHLCSASQQNSFRKLLDFCPLVNERKKLRKYNFKNCLCRLIFVGCSNTTEREKNEEFRTLKLYPLSVCELLPVLLVQCFKDILSTVVSKESWTISFMQLVNIQEPLRVILNFDVFLSKNSV